MIKFLAVAAFSSDFDDGDEDDDDNLGRQAGQMNLSLQTSLPVAFTFCASFIDRMISRKIF